MKNKNTIVAVLAVLVIVLILAVIFYPKKTGTEGSEVVPDNVQAPVIPENQITRIQISGTELVIFHDSPTPDSKPINLTAATFESSVAKCLQGESCVLEDDAMKMYQDFKTAGNNGAVESLVVFLRSQLRKPELKDKYKGVVKSIIDDFYPPQEKQFQEAAYYNFMGDLNKSLELYLDLKEKSKTDKSLKGTPNLNLANIYYDMKKYADAQPYYEEALQEYSDKSKTGQGPATFIEQRISEIKARLYHSQ